MTRREDLIQFFICANSAQDRQDFDLDKFTNDYLERNPTVNKKPSITITKTTGVPTMENPPPPPPKIK